MPKKLLFVCLGNICRSPAAENIMNRLVERESLNGEIICDSAGTSGYHSGDPPDSRMAAAACQQGISLRGSARQFTAADFETFDLILAMDQDNYRDILRLDRERKFRHKVHLICEFCTRHSEREVPDPYYGGDAGFRHVIELLTDACEGLLRSVRGSDSQR